MKTSKNVKETVKQVTKELMSLPKKELETKIKKHKMTWFGEMLLESGAADIIKKRINK